MPRKTKAERDQEALAKENALNTNRDGILIRPGQMWRDLNPRAGGRMISISAVQSGKAATYDGNRSGELAVTRMYPHSRGYEIVGSP